MRLSWICLAVALALSGCASVCDEVADEAEASGCAKGVLPDVGGGSSAEALTECTGEREARAQCLLDLTDNVCAPTAEEADALTACFEAAKGAQ